MLLLNDFLYGASFISELNCPGFQCPIRAVVEKQRCLFSISVTRGIYAGEALGIESSTGDDMMAHSYFSPEVDDVRRRIDGFDHLPFLPLWCPA